MQSSTKSIVKIKSCHLKSESNQDGLERVTYGTGESRFGNYLLALKKDHVCYLSFVDSLYLDLSELQKAFPKTMLFRDDNVVTEYAQQIFNNNNNPQEDFKVALKGTEFEIKVWEHLINLKKGSTTTYEQVAKSIGCPKAVRAVANAIAKNKIAYLVPCHRVISKNGALNKYRWGARRKQQMLREEEIE